MQGGRPDRPDFRTFLGGNRCVESPPMMLERSRGIPVRAERRAERRRNPAPGGRRHRRCLVRPVAFDEYGFRYYDPVTGRWASKDPLGDHAFFQLFAREKEEAEQKVLLNQTLANLYGLVNNTPTDHIDKHGLISIPVIDPILDKAELRRGRGPWEGSAQHCWAACYFAALNPAAGTWATIFADLGEIPMRDDWALAAVLRKLLLAGRFLPRGIVIAAANRGNDVKPQDTLQKAPTSACCNGLHWIPRVTCCLVLSARI
jgi:RHS repeat-associated protein